MNAYERNPKARELCIQNYGYRCSVCEFDFGEIYGEIGTGFIHVHHLKPLSEINEEYQVDPINDLRPVCPNCHSMLHKANFSIEQLRDTLRKIRELSTIKNVGLPVLQVKNYRKAIPTRSVIECHTFLMLLLFFSKKIRAAILQKRFHRIFKGGPIVVYFDG